VRAPEALNVLAVHLQGHGLTRLYGATEGRLGVLSVAEGVTVWTDGKVLRWHINGEETRVFKVNRGLVAVRLPDVIVSV